MSELEREFATRIALPEVQYQVGRRMEQIVGFFKPGVKIAVMVRSPGFPDRDFMMTDDDLTELHEMLNRREAASQQGVAKDTRP